MRIIVETEGGRLEIDEDQLESFGLSIPSDVYMDGEFNTRELGRVHISLTGIFKEGVRPEWREINE